VLKSRFQMKWKRIECSRGAKGQMAKYTCDDIPSTLLCPGVRAYQFPIQVDMCFVPSFSINSIGTSDFQTFFSMPGNPLGRQVAYRDEEDRAHVPRLTYYRLAFFGRRNYYAHVAVFHRSGSLVWPDGTSNTEPKIYNFACTESALSTGCAAV
jgi:hypothetical protein